MKNDPEFDAAVNHYIESLVALEKEEFKPGFESFEVHAEKLRQNLTNVMQGFYESYTRGYDVLIEELAKEYPVTEQNPTPLALFTPHGKGLTMLSMPTELLNFLTEGHPLYEALGFTTEALNGFYKAGYQLVEQKRFEDARDGFYFLVTIAPQMGVALLGLGYCYLECKMNESAVQALSRAIELMPGSHEAYLIFARVFIEMQDFDQAKKVCDLGIDYAEAHKENPTSQELLATMQEAKKQIEQLFQKSQSQSSYSS